MKKRKKSNKGNTQKPGDNKEASKPADVQPPAVDPANKPDIETNKDGVVEAYNINTDNPPVTDPTVTDDAQPPAVDPEPTVTDDVDPDSTNADNEPEVAKQETVPYKTTECPGCKSKEVKTTGHGRLNETTTIRYHKCKRCGRLFKSEEEK